MPELPEVEALRRALDDPVRAFPIEKAGPAHIATLKTFDPPLATLEGRRLAGVERRAKRLLFPTEDGELVVLLHLMSAERLADICANESRRLHSLLRDQRLIAGIGRAWANEILHRAKLSPYALTYELEREEVDRLAAAIDAELDRGLELRERGANDKRTYRVHDKLGQPCYVCGTPIARVDFEEHTIYYCPECQTGGRVLKDRRLSRLLR